MKFNDLTNKRKLAVQILVAEYPEIKETGTITLKQLRTWWDDKYSKLESREVGYPIWLFSEKEFRTDAKGVYAVPLPDSEADLVKAEKTIQKKVKAGVQKKAKTKTLKDLTSVCKESTMEIGTTEEVLSDDEFAAELRAAGIEI